MKKLLAAIVAVAVSGAAFAATSSESSVQGLNGTQAAAPSVSEASNNAADLNKSATPSKSLNVAHSSAKSNSKEEKTSLEATKVTHSSAKSNSKNEKSSLEAAKTLKATKASHSLKSNKNEKSSLEAPKATNVAKVEASSTTPALETPKAPVSNSSAAISA